MKYYIDLKNAYNNLHFETLNLSFKLHQLENFVEVQKNNNLLSNVIKLKEIVINWFYLLDNSKKTTLLDNRAIIDSRNSFFKLEETFFNLPVPDEALLNTELSELIESIERSIRKLINLMSWFEIKNEERKQLFYKSLIKIRSSRVLVSKFRNENPETPARANLMGPIEFKLDYLYSYFKKVDLGDEIDSLFCSSSNLEEFELIEFSKERKLLFHEIEASINDLISILIKYDSF